MKLYLAFGSNLGHREENISTAVHAVSKLDGCVLLARSAVYETRPLGFLSGNLFLNAVAVYETTLPPEKLLSATQRIERDLGRTKKSTGGTYSDRLIDIDLLMLGNLILQTPELTLPHPRMAERRFVLEPLCEIAPAAVVPGTGETAASLLGRLNSNVSIERADPPYSAEAESALRRLLPQLMSQPPAANAPLQNVDGLYLLRDETGEIQGAFTLITAPCLSGTKCWLEDVVVDKAARGRGYGRRMVEEAIARARSRGAIKLMLTSKPQREAANRLYRACGFSQRETNVYQLVL